MSDMPETILARPIMGAKPQSDTHTSGPWAKDDPYGNATEYVRADKVQALLDEERERCAKVADNFCARDMAEIIDEQGSGQTMTARQIAAAIRVLKGDKT